ncbi:MAG: hypothetical protein Aurels2KO_10300 [Aureliella sp.]
MAVIQYLDVILGAKTEKLDKGLSRSSKDVQDFRRDLVTKLPGGGFLQGAAGTLSKIGPAGIAAAGGVAVLTGAIAGTAIAISNIRDEMGAIDEIAKAAAQANVTFRELAGWRLAVGESSGLGESQADKAIVKLQLNLKAAQRSGNQLDQTLSTMGLNTAQLLESGPLDALRQISAATQGMQEPAAQLELAYLLFGERASALVNTLRAGPEALQETVLWADKMGLSLGQAQAKQVENANDAWGRVQVIATGVWRQIAAEAAPVLEVIADEILAFADSFGGTQEFLPTIVDGMLILSGVVFDLVQASTVFSRIWVAIGTMQFSDIGEAIKDAADFGTADRLLDKVNKARSEAALAAQQSSQPLEDTSAIDARIESEKAAQQATAARLTQLQQREKQLVGVIDQATDTATSSVGAGPTAGALERGSVAAFSAGNANERNAQAAAQQRADQLRVANESREELANIRREIGLISIVGNAG